MTGGASASDEFAEITNAGPVPIDLTGLELVYVTSSGSDGHPEGGLDDADDPRARATSAGRQCGGDPRGCRRRDVQRRIRGDRRAVALRPIGGDAGRCRRLGRRDQRVRGGCRRARAGQRIEHRAAARRLARQWHGHERQRGRLRRPGDAVSAEPGGSADTGPGADAVPSSTSTPTPSPAPTPTASPTSSPPPTPTPTATVPPTPSPTPTRTPTPSLTSTPAPTPTPTQRRRRRQVLRRPRRPVRRRRRRRPRHRRPRQRRLPRRRPRDATPTPTATAIPSPSPEPILTIAAARSLADGSLVTVSGTLTTGSERSTRAGSASCRTRLAASRSGSTPRSRRRCRPGRSVRATGSLGSYFSLRTLIVSAESRRGDWSVGCAGARRDRDRRGGRITRRPAADGQRGGDLGAVGAERRARRHDR